MQKTILLLKTLLLSTSQRNIFRYTTDQTKKKRIIAGLIGAFLLYGMIMAYGVLMCIGYGALGLTGSIPVMTALILSSLAFLFTLFKTNGYLFHFREYDMLMALPFSPGTVAVCKFFYMYLKSLPWYFSISIAMLIGYGYYAKPAVAVYLIWIILSLILPLIPMVIASFLGFLIAKISSGFRKTNLIQTILMMGLVIFGFSLRYIITSVMKNEQVEEIINLTAQTTDQAAEWYPPVRWFADAVGKPAVLPGLLLIGTSLILTLIVFCFVGRSYRQINSALMSHAANKNYRLKRQSQHSPAQAIAFKEYRRLVGSSAYMTNAAVGEVLTVLFGILTLLFGFERIVLTVTMDAPIDVTILQPAIPFLIYFFIGMVSTTACSFSLEGKNYWILQSLPVTKEEICQGKMLFNLYLTIPFMTFGILCMCISARVALINTLLYVILGTALCAFSTAWGAVCGIRFMRLDWENEIEVIKQGTAITLYLFPNMFACMILTVLMVILGMRIDHRMLTGIMTLIIAFFAWLSYRRALVLAKKL
ncbi:MAG: hypothetical protein IKE28_11750 [Solobacterium sp.]|nr:hypothetical protein [Solobacterium sp.]